MAQASVTITGLDKIAGGFAALASIRENPNKVLLPVGAKLQEQVARTFSRERDPATGVPWKRTGSLALSTRPGGGVGGNTLKDTGRLLQSLTASLPTIQGMSVFITSNLPYASIHQTGGEIAPKNAKMLSLPLSREARRAGGAGNFFKRNARKNPFIIRAKSGNAFVVTESRGKLTFHYLLKDKVTIPARPYAGFGNEETGELETLCLDIILAEVRSIFGSGGRNG